MQLPALNFIPPLSSKTTELIQKSAVRLFNNFDDIWPGSEKPLGIRTIQLLQLDRIGGREGYGGSRVFVVSFEGEKLKGKKCIKSVPLLLKVVEDDVKKAQNLLGELERYKKIRRYIQKEYCAMPIDSYADNNKKKTATSVLWSKFRDEEVISGLPFKAPEELRQLVERGWWERASKTLRATYHILQHAHNQSKSKQMFYLSHYKEYLRLDKKWEDKLQSALGSHDSIKAYEKEVRNPLKVLAKMREKKEKCQGKGRVGPIHGDLHPRNVLIGKIHNACVIDFGWASDAFHVIVDFVLMEVSIKFFYLPWNLSRREVLYFERLLADNFLLDKLKLEAELKDSILRGALKLIKDVRKAASAYICIADKGRFPQEYLLPLFLVTMGECAFASSVNNLEHLILSAGLLATRVEKTLVI